MDGGLSCRGIDSRGHSAWRLLHLSLGTTFVLRSGVDPTYTVIYDGQWPDNRPYATIHRIASSGDRHGIFHHIIRFALTRYDTLRIDTHQDNAPMRHAIAKEGFTYCGLIHCWNGDERLAFHLSKTQKEE